MDGTGEARARRRAARAERRHARWHGPPQPKDWRFFVGGVGRILIVLGLLMFGFVAYQLWGTGLEYAQAQDRLDDELEELFAGAPTTAVDATTAATTESSTSATITTTTTSTAPPIAGDSTTTAITAPPIAGDSTSTAVDAPPVSTPPSVQPVPSTTSTTAAPVTIPVPPLDEGDALARIEIPRIGLDAVVVAGVQPSDLKQGPGHYPGTPMPGQLGNSAIAGHRTTYGQPFFDLDDIEPGDEIMVTTVQGRFVYRMTGSEVVAPDQGDVVLTKDATVATLTLTTCDPKYTATNRLIVYADLDPAASGGPGLPAVLDYGTGQPELPGGQLPGDVPATTSAPTTPSPAGSAVADATAPPASAGSTPATAAPAVSATPATTVLTEPAVDGEPTSAPSADDGADDGDPTAAGAGDDPTAGGANGDPTAVDAFSHGWFSDGAAWPHVIGWGLIGGAILVGGWFVARAFERYWVGALVAVVPFVVALYFFYQNVNRLLPAAI